ncbi:MAG TPA: hypothetical protein VFH92_01690 [Phenylobacterium sp.]|nr:hypothetical protein [Phenylobacterium sp.]
MPQFSLALAPSQLTQTINPWSWSFGDVSLFSVHLGESSDPAFEARVLTQVGTYGRQIGRMGEALAVLMKSLDRAKFSADELKAIDAFLRQADDIADLKRQHGPGRLSADGSPGTPARNRPGASLHSVS